MWRDWSERGQSQKSLSLAAVTPTVRGETVLFNSDPVRLTHVSCQLSVNSKTLAGIFLACGAGNSNSAGHVGTRCRFPLGVGRIDGEVSGVIGLFERVSASGHC